MHVKDVFILHHNYHFSSLELVSDGGFLERLLELEGEGRMGDGIRIHRYEYKGNDFFPEQPSIRAWLHEVLS